LNSKWQCALYRPDCKFFLRSYLTVCCCANPVAVVSSPAERGRYSSLADGLLSMFLRTLLLEAGLRTFTLTFRCGTGAFLRLRGVDDSHDLVVNGRTVVVGDSSEGVGLVHVDDGHGSEVLAELIEVVVAVE